MSNAQQFDTRPAGEHASEIAVESPLAYSMQRSGAPKVKADTRVTLRERAFLGQLTLRGGAIVLDEALREVLGLGPRILRVETAALALAAWAVLR